MPGPGPRGPRQTYRAPCSRFEDSRILARNPRKPGNSRGARGTRTRQSGTRSTRDGLSCGENRSAAGGTRPSIPGCRRAAHRNRAAGLEPRAAHRPRARPVPTSSTREPFFLSFFAVFAKNRQKTAEPGPQIWSEFSVKNRELAELRQFCPNFFAFLGRVASAAERNPAHGSPDRAGAPAYRVRLVALDHRIRARDPPGPHAPSRLQGPCF